jgi:hypothetical protein
MKHVCVHAGSIGDWAQCGGSSGNCNQYGACADAPFPGTSCASGSCVRINEWYHQCQPGSGTGGSSGGSGGSSGSGGGSSRWHLMVCACMGRVMGIGHRAVAAAHGLCMTASQ